MNKKTTYASMAVLAAFAGTLWCLTDSHAASKKRKKAAAVAQEDSGAQASSAPSGSMKGSLEAYLRRRQTKLERTQKSRGDFITKEGEIWTSFWNKVFDERNLFEVRIARQRLDLIESLSSIDANDRAASVSDFEKLQANEVKSFEERQRQKMQNFFNQRDARWKEFGFQQEKDRAEFADEAESSWQSQKAALLGESEGTGGREAAPRSGGRGNSRGSNSDEGTSAPDASNSGGTDWNVR